ncbi:MAG: PorV/PorQ family protein [Elusimicrobia bacterium]|nr:PorV/PorQ family protein [Elusimicrobiota bacterium]
MRAPFALAVLLLAAPAVAESGRTSAAFLRRALSARAAGMGGAHAAVLDCGADAPQFNPAGLARLRRPALASSYLSGFGDVTHGHLAYAQPLPIGTLGVGLLYFNAGSLELNLSDGTKGRVTAEEDNAWTLSYGLPLIGGLSAGATYRYVRLELAQAAQATSHQGDAGLLWRSPVPGLSFAAAYQYHGGNIVFEEAGDPPPKTWRYGLALRLPDIDARKLDPEVDLEEFDLTAAADIVKTVFESASPRAGVELGLTPPGIGRVALRFGWVFNRFAEGMSFGLGFKAGRLGFDYGYGSAGELSALQNVSMSWTF